MGSEILNILKNGGRSGGNVPPLFKVPQQPN